MEQCSFLCGRKIIAVYYLMKELNIVGITSRSKHAKQDLEAQDDFKKFLMEVINLIPGHVALK